MTKLLVDGIEVDVPDHYTLLQACEEAGAEIPRFCYHERLSIAGNCRMCLVEVKGGPPKPQASCAMGVRDLRPGPNGEPPEVMTRSPMVKKAREGVMEFLLINHPLDCPICDQGGECDLQDQAMAYGVDKNRFHENKRAVEDKYIGPLVRTRMTRCIHCTRCVRFTTEVAGISELGLIGRGEDAEITTYLERAMSSELQGNVIDLCPVGALTSKPYQDQARPWELSKTESVDVMDAVGSNIRVDARGREVMRILPRTHEDVNEEWISDKTRFVWDGLRSQRLDRPYVRTGGKLQAATWNDAFAAIASKMKGIAGERVGMIAGDLAGVEEMFALKDLAERLEIASIDCRQDGSVLDRKSGRGSYIFNSGIAGIEEADAILIVGANPRLEASVLNARIRKRWLLGDLVVGYVGAGQPDLTYEYEYIGAGPESLAEIAGGEGSFARRLKKAKRPMIIVGQGATTRPDGAAILAQCADIAVKHGMVAPENDPDWIGFNVLHNAASRVGGLDVGFLPAEGGRATGEIIEAAGKGELDVVFLLGADEIDMSALGGAFVVYIGTHGDRGAHRADVILPGAAYTEKAVTYVNTEGRPQMTARAAFPPGEAREDWAIIRALSEHLGARLPYDSIAALRAVLYADMPHLAALDRRVPSAATDVMALARKGGRTRKGGFAPAIGDFYLTNPIARASKVMAEASALAAQLAKEATGTHG
ncbi:MAG: NADH-quinone oxidoreductase subunit NuoG [Flavobacteriaceae bacterium]